METEHLTLIGLRASQAISMDQFTKVISGEIRWYWLNAIGTSFADSLVSFALILLVLDTTGSLSLMASMSIAMALPNIAFGLPISVWVDRWHPVHVVRNSQVFRALIISCFVFAARMDAIWPTFCLAFLQAVVGTFDDPSRAKLARALTTHASRLAINSFTQAGKTVAIVAGASAAGMIVAGTDSAYGTFFLVAALCYAALGWVVSNISTDSSHFQRHDQATGRYRDEILVGLRAVRTSSTLVAVIVAAMTTTIGAAAATVLLTPFIVDDLMVTPAWFGLVEASQATGTILVSIAIGIAGARINTRLLLVWSLIGTGTMIALIGATQTVWSLLICMLAVGITLAPVNSSFSTLLQSHADPTIIGRIAAVMNMFIEPCSILGMAGAGLLAAHIGIRPVFSIAGVFCFGGGILVWVLMRSDDHMPSSACNEIVP